MHRINDGRGLRKLEITRQSWHAQIRQRWQLLNIFLLYHAPTIRYHAVVEIFAHLIIIGG